MLPVLIICIVFYSKEYNPAMQDVVLCTFTQVLWVLVLLYVDEHFVVTKYWNILCLLKIAYLLPLPHKSLQLAALTIFPERKSKIKTV